MAAPLHRRAYDDATRTWLAPPPAAAPCLCPEVDAPPPRVETDEVVFYTPLRAADDVCLAALRRAQEGYDEDAPRARPSPRGARPRPSTAERLPALDGAAARRPATGGPRFPGAPLDLFLPGALAGLESAVDAAAQAERARGWFT